MKLGLIQRPGPVDKSPSGGGPAEKQFGEKYVTSLKVLIAQFEIARQI